MRKWFSFIRSLSKLTAEQEVQGDLTCRIGVYMPGYDRHQGRLHVNCNLKDKGYIPKIRNSPARHPEPWRRPGEGPPIIENRLSIGDPSSRVTGLGMTWGVTYLGYIVLLGMIIPCILHAALPAHFNPYSLEPGLIGRNIDPGVVGQTLYKQSRPTPQKPSPPTVPGTTPVTQKEVTDQIHFQLNKVVLSGNQAIASETIQALFNPFLHQTITLTTLIMLVQKVTDLYKEKGYFLSKAILPPQAIEQGVVQITIVEGFISHVEIDGIKGRNQTMLSRYGNTITALHPAQLNALERSLLLMNDIPGFDVQSFIAPDSKTPLGSNLTLKPKYKPIYMTISHDNFQTLYLGPKENSFYSSINSFLLPGGTLYISSIVADSAHKLQYYEVRHTQTLGTHGLVLDLDGYYTETNPGFILAPLEIFGYSGDVNISLNYPFIRSKTRNLNAELQADYLNSHSNALGDLLYRDKIRDVTLSLSYQDILWKGEDSVNFIIDQGFKILGAHDVQPLSDAEGSSNYLKLNLTASRTQYFSNKYALYVFFSGQYANRPLLAAEDFVFGGPYLGRGYDFAQFTGDEGVAGSVEFRVNFPTQIPHTKIVIPFLQYIQGYIFYDVGQLWNLNLTTSSEVTSGASAGLGIRTQALSHINFSGFLGKPLTTDNATQVLLNKNGHAFLGFFQISAFL